MAESTGRVRASAPRVAFEDAVAFAGMQGDIPPPASESATRVDGLDPFGEVLLVVRHRPRRQDHPVARST